MKASIVTSAALHCALLAWALVSIGSPEQFKVEDFEAMPVDLVPIEEMTQMQQGDKKASRGGEVRAEADDTGRPIVAERREHAARTRST